MENKFTFIDSKYQKLGEEISGIVTKINGVITTVPIEYANIHYAEIMRQVEAGELTIEPADELWAEVET